MTTCSTHVLDAALGRPAAGLPVVLTDPQGTVVEEAATDLDGRVRFTADLGPGPHRLTFATGTWFDAQERECFFPDVTIHFAAGAEADHDHVAVLLSPFSYTTYRGS
ncbi:hydroxyisourate hydrolase [Nocardioides caeni]|uniref:5-hydroxyisourate hydrolase n=1 Tax=Nocardioides caeni TaxID=574700 RepID=A0A4S8NEK3_9ACTN|nr:hydroxyisourate hydrolase [Nocardioides caeni]THV14531.1 hydroxyisourate hydrolase [Nocardioides caeni]